MNYANGDNGAPQTQSWCLTLLYLYKVTGVVVCRMKKCFLTMCEIGHNSWFGKVTKYTGCRPSSFNRRKVSQRAEMSVSVQNMLQAIGS